MRYNLMLEALEAGKKDKEKCIRILKMLTEEEVHYLVKVIEQVERNEL